MKREDFKKKIVRKDEGLSFSLSGGTSSRIRAMTIKLGSLMW